MPVCNGQGANGTHCCFIAGEVCQFLDTSGEIPRCSVWGNWDGRWHEAPVGRWFAETYPGFDCGDWPQNIPEVMAAAPTAGPFYACCWGRGNDG